MARVLLLLLLRCVGWRWYPARCSGPVQRDARRTRQLFHLRDNSAVVRAQRTRCCAPIVVCDGGTWHFARKLVGISNGARGHEGTLPPRKTGHRCWRSPRSLPLPAPPASSLHTRRSQRPQHCSARRFRRQRRADAVCTALADAPPPPRTASSHTLPHPPNHAAVLGHCPGGGAVGGRCTAPRGGH